MKINIPTPSTVAPSYITGHVYLRREGAAYLAASNNALVNLRTGYTWSKGRGFNGKDHEFTDMGHISTFISD